ncbi:TM0106 family RecB-like putative nuclease [Ruania suaedae]|uniref:TM0106 family RecB-like putative nuclease n=1 Tax=Ruania suaedae TaxID=2897774 RepID=UPI001E394686|nr:TM0106 family RecB-like putative nuclease [Ruania suaedae]UFU04551.1 TM0106 family RecB-like putative nuclease [Ruania suaedae]
MPALEITDPIRERAARLGVEHEAAVLAGLRERFGAGVVEIGPPTGYTPAALTEQDERTAAALRSGADVVYQGGFFDGRFHGRPDFLVREGARDGQARYAVVDSKLARSAKPKAVLQVAAYAAQLLRLQVPLAGHTRLVLGTGETSEHESMASVAVHREHRRHVQHLLDSHRLADGPVRWGEEWYTACLWCEYCRAEIARTRDVRTIWGVRARHRDALRGAGLETIDDVAAAGSAPPEVDARSWERIHAQAALQLQQERAADPAAVLAEVHDRAGLDALPPPDAGDVFFDFEGDPLWVDSDRSEWGLEYLFGLLEDEGTYVTFWAHDRPAEAVALRDFLAYLRRRRAQYPGMHVYHYAAYEQDTLRSLTRRHRVGEEEVGELLAAGVFVDLYATVKASVRISQPSYSLKKLEPLYMGSTSRDDSGVTTGGDSVLAYERACALREQGEDEAYRRQLDVLADYNRYDCLSTRRLRDWLLAQRDAAPPGRAAGGTAGAPADSGGRIDRAGAADRADAGERADVAARPDPATGPAAERETDVTEVAGLEAGLHLVPVDHRENGRSAAEAAEVVAQVGALLGRPAVDAGRPRPLEAADVLVVAAQPRQQRLLREALDAAGHPLVRVGDTTGALDGRAPVTVGSLALSSPDRAPGGLAGVLDPWSEASAGGGSTPAGRLILVHSPALQRTMPRDAADLTSLGRFLRRCSTASMRRRRLR